MDYKRVPLRALQCIYFGVVALLILAPLTFETEWRRLHRSYRLLLYSIALVHNCALAFLLIASGALIVHGEKSNVFGRFNFDKENRRERLHAAAFKRCWPRRCVKAYSTVFAGRPDAIRCLSDPPERDTRWT